MTHNATAQAINEAFAAGRSVTINGREVWSRWSGAPASTWGNGSMSVDVRGRSARAQGTVWVKEGESCTVEMA